MNYNQNIVAVIQARMGSTRLPGKVLMEIDGIPLLGIMLSRVTKAELLDNVIIATSTSPADDKIETFCKINGYNCFRGSENDVLDRYYQTSKKYHADTVVRLTSDCPLIDPEIIDNTIKLYYSTNVDYAANTAPPEKKKYPDGSDVEVFSFKNLKKIWNEAKDPKDREHVTFYFWKRGKSFKTAMLDNEKDWGKYRITIDYPEDFEVIEFLVKEIDRKGTQGSLNEIVEILDANPDICRKNSMYTYGLNW